MRRATQECRDPKRDVLHVIDTKPSNRFTETFEENSALFQGEPFFSAAGVSAANRRRQLARPTSLARAMVQWFALRNL